MARNVSPNQHPGLVADIKRLLNALQQGDDGARSKLDAIYSELIAYRDRRIYYKTPEPCDPELTHEQCWSLSLVMSEWKQMFAFSPGRVDGIPSLLALVDLVRRTPHLEVTGLFRDAAWKQLVQMRGPVETIIVAQCNNCATEYIVIGTSGFMDMYGAVCDRCGNVALIDIYGKHKDVIPACTCGGKYVVGCPSCQSREKTILREISPYEYFLTHQYRAAK